MKKKYLTVIYVGKRLSVKDTVISCFKIKEEIISFKRGIGYHTIGQTYILEKRGTSYQFPKWGLKDAKEQIKIPKKEIAKWEREEDFAVAENKYLIEKKKLSKKSDWIKILDPIKEEYLLANESRRAAIEVTIMFYLRRKQGRITFK